MTEITTKQKFYELCERGMFGNYPRWWQSVDEVEKSGFKGTVSIRSKQIANPVKLYHIPVKQLRKVINGLPGPQRNSGLVFSEGTPDDKRTIQGEWDGFNLTYTFHQDAMRIALAKEALSAQGPRARMLLKGYLDAGDYEWLCDLEEQFPNHTIEFSGFTVRLGQLKTKMFIWEVRKY